MTISATGNSANNVMRGNAGNNALRGGTGNDTYHFGLGGGEDVVTDEDGTAGTTDQLACDAGIGTHDVRFVQSGSDLVLKVTGTADEVTISGKWGQPTRHWV